MKLKTWLIISVVGNILLLGIISVYLFTPFLDFAVISTSVPRLCESISQQQPDQNPPFCQLWRGEL
jgi:hypothetical protein